MKSVFRSVIYTKLSFPIRPLNPNPHRAAPLALLPWRAAGGLSTLSSMASDVSGSNAPSSPTAAALEKQFEVFRHQLDGSGGLRERIRGVASEIESVTRIIQSSLLLIHQSRPIPEVVEKAKGQIPVLRELYSKLAEIIQEYPGQYYRYHGDWRTETQTVVSLLAFMHYLETESLLLHAEAEEKLGLNPVEFGLDVEDYLVGICFMSNDLPRYVVNQVTAGDYDCPRKVLKFLTDLHAAFRMLNLRNDFLRKKFDGMKYDLRRVEEVYYDVKIRGLAAKENSGGDQGDEQPSS
ncbi:translin family protein [Striga asiatica]|uniref:Translin family protein n=1 Tax=Striga asiatica TaxID=4170 RepID=A0A5A7QS01_STRAF|nr:translin family protein [Striga asiatica]